MKKLFVFLSFVFAIVLFDNTKVYGYRDVCNESVVRDDYHEYGVCYKKLIYLMDDNKEKSSYLVANRSVSGNNVILYAGVIDGIETFYARSFNFYGVVYDDTGFSTRKNDMWYDLSIDNIMIKNGAFDDNFIWDQSSEGFHLTYNQVGTYIIRQFVNRKFYSSIRVIVVDDELGINVKASYIGDDSINQKEIVYDTYDLKFELENYMYGHQDEVKISVNSCALSKEYDSVIIVNKEELEGCFLENKKNKISLTVYNGFHKEKTFSYSLNLTSKDVSISLENSISTPTSTSQRILINAKAGANKEIDKDYSLYYWSTSSSDGLTYEDFMANYQKSDNRGTYSSNRGVILREKEGTYYLYALAKDDDSYVVVRSSEFIMEKKEVINSIILSDIAVVLLMLAFAALPILIYLKVRESDTK